MVSPFRSYIEALNYQGNVAKNYHLRSIVFNVLLFIPLGVIISSFLSGRAWLALKIGFIITIVTEVCQYCTSLGWAEIDDVINYSLGMVIGIAIYILPKKQIGKQFLDGF